MRLFIISITLFYFITQVFFSEALLLQKLFRKNMCNPNSADFYLRDYLLLLFPLKRHILPSAHFINITRFHSKCNSLFPITLVNLLNMHLHIEVWRWFGSFILDIVVLWVFKNVCVFQIICAYPVFTCSLCEIRKIRFVRFFCLHSFCV